MFVYNDSLRVNIIQYRHCLLIGHVRWNVISYVGQVKSFVDDLNKERGTVSMRVAFVLRSAEVQPLFRRFVRVCVDTCHYMPCIHQKRQFTSPPNSNQSKTQNKPKTFGMYKMPIPIAKQQQGKNNTNQSHLNSNPSTIIQTPYIICMKVFVF